MLKIIKTEQYITIQEVLLLQRERATRLSVELLQLRNIPFEKDCNRRMILGYSTLNVIAIGAVLLDRQYVTSC